MSEYEPKLSGWAIGGVTFAASMMVLIGTFQFLAGLAAIVEDDLFVVTRNYAFDLDVSAWGWIHLVLGIVVFCAGLALFAGKAWAAIVALVLAILSAIANFFFIPYYPWWSLLVIALAVWVMWALTRPGVIEA